MKYILALALLFATIATYAAPLEELEKALYDLDTSKVEQFAHIGITTPEQQTHYIDLAEKIKAKYIPLPIFYKSGKDMTRILGGIALYKLANTIINIGADPDFTSNGVAGGAFLCGCSIALIPTFFGIRHIIRGLTSYSARKDLHKIISIIGILKSVHIRD